MFGVLGPDLGAMAVRLNAPTQTARRELGSLAGELGIPVNLLTNSYFQCLEEVNGIWGQLMSTSVAAEKS